MLRQMVRHVARTGPEGRPTTEAGIRADRGGVFRTVAQIG